MFALINLTCIVKGPRSGYWICVFSVFIYQKSKLRRTVITFYTRSDWQRNYTIRTEAHHPQLAKERKNTETIPVRMWVRMWKLIQTGVTNHWIPAAQSTIHRKFINFLLSRATPGNQLSISASLTSVCLVWTLCLAVIIRFSGQDESTMKEKKTGSEPRCEERKIQNQSGSNKVLFKCTHRIVFTFGAS